jgi:hypothetical protein
MKGLDFQIIARKRQPGSTAGQTRDGEMKPM